MKRQVVIPTPTAAAMAELAAAPAPTILEIKQARQRSARLVDASRNRVVCRFWSEKLLLVVDALQVYALLWQLSQPWPWPARWLAWTRWTNAFNLDAFSFRTRGAAMGATLQPFSLWGEMPHYWLYALAFAAVPHALVAALWAAARRWQAQGLEDFVTRRCLWTNALVHVLYVAYLPVGLAVVRLVNCGADGRVAVDPYTFPTCGSAAHILVVICITGVFGASFLLLFPWWLRRQIRRATFTMDTAEHERFVQTHELAYVLGISDTYMDLYIPQFGSFLLHGRQTMVHMCIVKLALLVVFSFLRSTPPSTAHQGTQGSLFFAALLLIAWRQTWRPVFRIASTNQLAKLLAWLLVANGVIALLCANGVRSALTVATSVTASLSFVNLVALSVSALWLAHSAKQWRHRHDLTPLPGGVLRADHPCWPTYPLMDEIISERVPLDDWITILREIRVLSIQTAIAAPTTQPFHKLTPKARQLEAYWHAAKASNHLLATHLHQELLLLSDLVVEAVATSPFTDADLQATYGAEFAALADRLRRRDDAQRLVPAAQRRVMSKLRAAAAWTSNPAPVPEAPKL